MPSTINLPLGDWIERGDVVAPIVVRCDFNSHKQGTPQGRYAGNQFDFSTVFKVVAQVHWVCDNGSNMRQPSRIVCGMPLGCMFLGVDAEESIAWLQLKPGCSVDEIDWQWPEVTLDKFWRLLCRHASYASRAH